jgi:hypothetical protein
MAIETVESVAAKQTSNQRSPGTRIGTNLRGYRWQGKDRGVGFGGAQAMKNPSEWKELTAPGA